MNRIAVLLVALGVLAPGAARCADSAEIVLGPEHARTLGIETAPILGVTEEGSNGLPARVVIPTTQIRVVSAPVAGLVQSTAVAVGDPVKRGQALVRMDSPGLVEGQRALLHASTEAGLARELLHRDEQLFREGIIAESRLLTARGRVAEANAAVAERRQILMLSGMSEAGIKALLASGGMTAGLTLASPMDGVVLEVPAMAGQRAEAATPLVKVARLAPLWLEILVPAAQLDMIRVGAPVNLPAHRAGGRVVSVSQSVDPANQTILVRAEIHSGVANLRPGQLVEVNVLWEPTSMHWHVPPGALVREKGEALLFVQTAKGFRAQPVKIVAETHQAATVSAKFRGDERIAVKGVSGLKALRQGIGGE